MKRPVRHDGFVPIADYAVVGDGRTVALIATDGSVDWWPCPTLKAPPLCAALIDPDRGGHFVLRPVGAYEVDRRYLYRTNVLESTYRTSQGVVTVTQALNVGSSGRLPWVEFAHRIAALSGQVTMHWEWRPGDRFGRVAPWITSYHGTPMSIVGDQVVGVITDDAIECTVDDDREAMRSTFTVEPGNHRTIALVVSDREPLFIPDLAAVDERLNATIQHWCRWSHGLIHAGPWTGAVERSALALKLLLAEDTGAIAAASTTSLPERIGGAKNWDYRFAWVRDTSFTLDALINLGLHEEVQRSVAWLVDAIRRNGPGLHVFYTLGGEVSRDQEELAAPGYAHSRPVRAGNRAAGQTQLGNYGDLFDTIWRYCEQGHVLDAHTARLLADLADQCCDTWRNPDAGIWELTEREHYTISKIGCWVALDRAARLADEGQITDVRSARWHEEAEHIRTWIDTNCWSEARHAYTFFAGTEDLDAAVLLAGRTGFDHGKRLATTIAAIREELSAGPLLYRYSGAKLEEGAFVACTFWMVEALAFTGQCDEATELMHQGTELVNDVGLLAEEIDVEFHSFLGNFPQGLSHLALINAAFTLQRCATTRGRNPMNLSSSNTTHRWENRRPKTESVTPAQTAFVAARVSWGCILLVVPSRLTGALGLSSDRRAMMTMRVLGLRHLIQAAAVGGRGERVRGGALVDLLHGASMLLLACVDTRRRKAALLDAGVAFAFAAGGLTARTANVGASVEPQPELFSRVVG